MNGIKIKDKMSRFPLIQGGMGVGISLHRLAGSVSKAGGIGVISAADVGFREPDFLRDPRGADCRALKQEIAQARAIAGSEGIIGVNIMVAAKGYEEIVQSAVDGGADLIISGAGLPRDLAKLTEGSDIAIAPIVSSRKACRIITEYWLKSAGKAPDMIVIEGPEAGGHLGFSSKELESMGFSPAGASGECLQTEDPLQMTLLDMLPYVREVEERIGRPIPVVVAGGIWDSNDICHYMEMGASGVQMGTRFVTTEECDASDEYKQAYINASAADIRIVKSPVGMPGRAVRNAFIQQTELGRIPVKRCYRCIHRCDPATTPYCISRALINACEGRVDEGLVFCGSNAGRCDRIVTVAELVAELFPAG